MFQVTPKLFRGFFWISAISLLAYESYSWISSKNLNYPFFDILVLFNLTLWGLLRYPILKDIIGEDEYTPHFKHRSLVGLLLSIPFGIYTLITLFNVNSGASPSLTNFSIIAISPTLGGLVFTAASSQRIDRQAHIELMSAAKKMLSSTALFLIFVPSIYFVSTVKGFNPNQIELNSNGFTYGGFFWLSAYSFYLGLWLFVLGLIDLLWALRRL